MNKTRKFTLQNGQQPNLLGEHGILVFELVDSSLLRASLVLVGGLQTLILDLEALNVRLE